MPKLAYRTTNPNPNDPDIAQRFSDAIRAGHPVATAAVLAGISERTARRYLAQGKQAEEEQGSPCLFWQMFKEAEADFVSENLAAVQRDAAKPGGWTAAMTLLERRRPQDFGRNQRVDVESKSVVLHASLPQLAEQKLLSIIKDQLASGETLFLEAPGTESEDPPPLDTKQPHGPRAL